MKRTLKEQRAYYHSKPLNIQPEHKGAKDELHMVERNILALYKQITFSGSQDVVYMSRRVAQSIGLYLPGTQKADVKQSEEVILSLVKKEYLKMTTFGKDIMISYNVKAEPVAPKLAEPLPGTKTLFDI
tara:strand:- start:2604 stop:2990 length:387 start_codon:yes stop_codon:yes gene_type:complete